MEMFGIYLTADQYIGLLVGMLALLAIAAGVIYWNDSQGGRK